MNRVLSLFAVVAILGAADTIYYHEWRARLPGRGRQARAELQLHAYRDFVYAILFGTLPWLVWQGSWTLVLAGLLLIEIVLTLWDFVVEDWIRKPLGGVYPGERIMHAIMGIIFGAMLANFVPLLLAWWRAPSGLLITPAAVHPALRWIMLLMAFGVFLSGVRDLCAAYEVPGSAWPWNQVRGSEKPGVDARSASAK
jgi:hypothetical protein